VCADYRFGAGHWLVDPWCGARVMPRSCSRRCWQAHANRREASHRWTRRDHVCEVPYGAGQLIIVTESGIAIVVDQVSVSTWWTLPLPPTSAKTCTGSAITTQPQARQAPQGLAMPGNRRITLHFTPTGCSGSTWSASSRSSPARPSAGIPSPLSSNSAPPSAPSLITGTKIPGPSPGPRTPTRSSPASTARRLKQTPFKHH
jgi:hypothetical protein